MQVKKILKDSFFEVLTDIEPSKLINNRCTFNENELIINNQKIALPKNNLTRFRQVHQSRPELNTLGETVLQVNPNQFWFHIGSICS